MVAGEVLHSAGGLRIGLRAADGQPVAAVVLPGDVAPCQRGGLVAVQQGVAHGAAEGNVGQVGAPGVGRQRGREGLADPVPVDSEQLLLGRPAAGDLAAGGRGETMKAIPVALF